MTELQVADVKIIWRTVIFYYVFLHTVCYITIIVLQLHIQHEYFHFTARCACGQLTTDLQVVFHSKLGIWCTCIFEQHIYYLIKNSQAVKKGVRPLKRLWWKKMWNPRWRPRNGCDGRLMVKILITTIQVNFVPRPSGTKFTWIVVIKIFTINLPSQPFFGRHLGFHIFFHHSLFKGRTPFFTAWLFLIRFHFFLYLYTPKPAYGQLWGFLTYIFFFTTGKRKRWSRFYKYFNSFWFYQ